MYQESAGAGGAPIDRYVVQEYLAEGGMGAIYLGKRIGAGGFEKQVVLKQLLPEFTQQPEFIDLFLREARLSATLDHANIIHTIDLVTAGDEYFIVMEFLDGADLRTLLKRGKLRKVRLAAAAGIYIAREILSALSYAHSKLNVDGKPLSLIHRDISPSNILISKQGEAKLTDFGIAKASTHNSVFYRVKGKVGYMSPEQAQSEHLDARSDLYSLAVCLYEMITGERLFLHVGLTTSAEEMYKQPIPLVSRKVSDLPAEFDKLMLKALSVDPAHRYQTAGEFQEALLRVSHRHGLMMSAPELAHHLEHVAGEPDRWRELELESDEEIAARGGTEIYEPNGTVRLNAGELDDDDVDYGLDSYDDGPDMFSAVFELDQLVDEGMRRQKRAKTSVTHLTELKGLELTSMIKIVDDELAGDGAQPLVDLDAFGTIATSDLPAPAHRDIGDTGVLAAVEISDHGLAQLSSSDIHEGPAARSHSATPAEHEFDVRAAMASGWSPWWFLVLFLIAAGAVITAIGLSGPEIDPPSEESSGKGK